DNSRAFFRRMNAVALVERGVARDGLEQERHQRDVILARERGIHLVELYDVLPSEIRWRFHTRQDDGDAACLCALDDLRQISLQLVRRETAQPVVSAERDDDNADVAFERPVESTESPG